MMDSTTLKAMAAKLNNAALAAEGERSPTVKAQYDAAASDLAALQTAAGALVTALSADGATVAGCATAIAAVSALLPAD